MLKQVCFIQRFTKTCFE